MLVRVRLLCLSVVSFFSRGLSGETLHDELVLLERKIRDLEQGYGFNLTLVWVPLPLDSESS